MKRSCCLQLILITLLLTASCLSASAAIVKTHKTPQGWELLVDGKPFIVHGMCYEPVTIGESPVDNTRRNWEMVDDDHDGRNDFAYQTWVGNKKEIGDFELMRQMGVNVLRIYNAVSDDPAMQALNASSSKTSNYPPKNERKILRELYYKFGIRVAMGNLLGAYTVSTGANWNVGTDYTNPVQRANMLRSVELMVREHKDEPYVLMWILGNENNLAWPHTNASRQPEAYARFVNEAAALIKRIDHHHHPVVLCNGRDLMIEYYAKYAPQIDIFGMNIYQVDGFHEVWKRVAKAWDRPVVLTEFGTPFPIVTNGKFNENFQAQVHHNNWEDIIRHSAGHEEPGNAIGGFVFEWADNWWEDGDKWHHNTNPDNSGLNHEYNGLCSLGDGSAGSLTRQLRKVYWMYQELWKNDTR